MILTNNLITDLEIKTVNDLYKIKPLMEGTSLKINKSQIARELNVDRRTVSKYINGFKKSKTRKRENSLSPFREVVKELLSPDNRNRQLIPPFTIFYKWRNFNIPGK